MLLKISKYAILILHDLPSLANNLLLQKSAPKLMFIKILILTFKQRHRNNSINPTILQLHISINPINR